MTKSRDCAFRDRYTIGLLSMVSLLLVTMFWAGFLSLAASGVHAAPPPGKGGGNGGGDDDGGSTTPPSYSLTVLPDLNGTGMWARGMNEWGDIVGSANPPDGDHRSEPFVYFNDTKTVHKLYDFFTPEDRERWLWVIPTGINSSGQICGEGFQEIDGVELRFAFRFTPDVFNEQGGLVSGRVEAVSPGSGPSWSAGSIGQDINEWGDVAGTYRDGFDDTFRAFVYSDGFGFADIGDLGGDEAWGTAINNLGEMTGRSEYTLDSGAWRTFLFVPGSGMLDLGSLGGVSTGADVNDSATVVGFSVTKDKGSIVERAFRWTEANGMKALGTLGGKDSNSWADAINSHNEIVGESEDQDGSRQGFYYTVELGMLQLSKLVENLPEGTYRIEPVGINDAGEIAATLYSTGQAPGLFAVLLTPID